MLTLLSFTAIIFALCVFLLSDRYKLRPAWITTTAILFAVCVSTGVSMEQQYDSIWFAVSLNVVLLSALLAVHCYGNQEKLEWTEHLGEVTDSIHDQLLHNQHTLNELSKRIIK